MLSLYGLSNPIGLYIDCMEKKPHIFTKKKDKNKMNISDISKDKKCI